MMKFLELDTYFQSRHHMISHGILNMSVSFTDRLNMVSCAYSGAGEPLTLRQPSLVSVSGTDFSTVMSTGFLFFNENPLKLVPGFI